MTWTAEQLLPTLIKPLDTAKASNRTADIRLEPAFLYQRRQGLTLDSLSLADRTKADCAHAISRHPTNLRLHVQRILLYAKSQDPAILGPVCDLFIVLGDNGQPLRSRMLALARPLLSKIDYQILRRRLKAGDSDSDALHSLSAGAVLSRGITGVTRLIFKQTEQNEVREDPLDSAQAQLEYGQTELAQETLEKALIADSGRLELHLALLEIYRHARDRERTERLWQTLQGRKNPARKEWQQLLRQFDEEVRTP